MLPAGDLGIEPADEGGHVTAGILARRVGGVLAAEQDRVVGADPGQPADELRTDLTRTRVLRRVRWGCQVIVLSACAAGLRAPMRVGMVVSSPMTRGVASVMRMSQGIDGVVVVAPWGVKA